jgi:hypothetical protein
MKLRSGISVARRPGAGRRRRPAATALGGLAVSGLALGTAASLPTAALAATAAPAGAHVAATAKLTLGVKSGLPGQSVSFAGSGFKDKESVTLHWRTASGTKLDTVTATGKGAVSGHFAVPLPRAGVPARTSVVAVGKTSKRKASASFTQSCTDEWTATSGGDWSNVKDWSDGAVPSSATAACITLAGKKNYTVTLGAATGSTEVASLRVGATSGKTVQTLKLNPSGSDLHLQLDKTSTITTRGELLLTSTSGNPFLAGPGTLDNYGLFSTVSGKGWSRYLQDNIVNEPRATMSVADAGYPGGATYFGAGTTLTNKGTMTVAKGSALVVGQATFTQDGTLTNAGTVQDSQSTVNMDGGKASGAPWLLVNNVTLNDKAGTGSLEFQNGGSITGAIPGGQTVTVMGDASTDVRLGIPATFTNHGKLVLTSSTDLGGGGNSWIVPTSGSTATLTNDGTLDTENGVGWSRYLNVNITNSPGATMNLDAGSNYVVGGYGLINSGTLNIGDADVLQLQGTSYGQADFTQKSGGTLGVVIDAKKGTESQINQFGCSAGGCQHEFVIVAGTLKVTTIGSPSGTYAPLYDQFTPVSGSFARLVGAGSYTVSYNQPDSALQNLAGDVLLTH